MSGFCYFVGSNLVSWCSKGQLTVASHSTEAEIIAMSGAVKEGLWIEKIHHEVFCKEKPYLQLFADNQPSIHIAEGESHHGKSKHIDIRYMMFTEQVRNGTVKIVHCPTDTMVADVFTKVLRRVKFQRHRGTLLQEISEEPGRSIPIDVNSFLLAWICTSSGSPC